jgi:hypothetical protein
MKPMVEFLRTFLINNLSPAAQSGFTPFEQFEPMLYASGTRRLFELQTWTPWLLPAYSISYIIYSWLIGQRFIVHGSCFTPLRLHCTKTYHGNTQTSQRIDMYPYYHFQSWILCPTAMMRPLQVRLAFDQGVSAHKQCVFDINSLIQTKSIRPSMFLKHLQF